MELAKQTQPGLQKSGQCLSMRLQSFLAGTDPNILQVLQMETGKECIIAYYHDTLQFCNKPDKYWAEKFPADFMSWSVMLGLRTSPDKLSEIDVKNTLVGSFPHLNEETVKLAIKMNLEGQFGEVVQCYNAINRPYLTEILRKFDLKLKVDHKRLVELRDKFSPQRELSRKEKDDIIRQSCFAAFDSYKIGDFTAISYPIYDYLEKSGNITLENLPKQKRFELLSDADAEIKRIISGEGVTTEDVLKKVKAASGKDSIKNKAKELAVRFYFDSIDKLELPI